MADLAAGLRSSLYSTSLFADSFLEGQPCFHSFHSLFGRQLHNRNDNTSVFRKPRCMYGALGTLSIEPRLPPKGRPPSLRKCSLTLRDEQKYRTCQGEEKDQMQNYGYIRHLMQTCKHGFHIRACVRLVSTATAWTTSIFKQLCRWCLETRGLKREYTGLCCPSCFGIMAVCPKTPLSFCVSNHH